MVDSVTDREYEEVDFDAPIVKGSNITFKEYVSMSDEKRKEILESLKANSSPEM